jgi:aspartyl-tRNA(Asn)/glutamyl-tRNA(Gln) amidotransferase subunit A
MSLVTLSLAELLDRYRDRSVSPVEVADAVLAQIERIEPSINAYVVRENVDEVRRQAANAEARWHRGEPLGLLDGIPIAVKDTIAVAKWPTRFGSLLTPATPAPADAPATARVREAGAILLGKTTTCEFGWTGITRSPLTGVTRNPWASNLTPGGSSGGAAASVAAGAAIASLGTDAAGSLRIPAAFCGVVGFKATRGRVAVFPPSPMGGLGHVGPITRTVADAGIFLQVIAGPDVRDANPLPPTTEDFASAASADGDLRGIKVGYSPTLGHASVDPQVADLVVAAVRRLAELGAKVDEIVAPLSDAREPFRVLCDAATSHSLRQVAAADLDRLDPGLKATVERGRTISRQQYQEALDFQTALSREARLLHQRYDILVTPTVAVLPFDAGDLVPVGYVPDDWLAWTPFTYPFNLTGQPAISLPCGFTAQGLPVGMQIVGPLFGERAVLRAARAYERSMPFAPRQPTGTSADAPFH